MQLNELLDSYLETIFNPRTRRTYKTLYDNNMRSALGDVDISQVQPADLAEYFRKLEKPYPTKATLKSLLSGMYYYAIEIRLIQNTPVNRAIKLNNPGSKIKLPRLSIGAMKELLELTPENKPEHKTAYMLAAFCGLRRSEIYGLKREDIKDGLISISRAVSFVPGLGSIPVNPKRDKERLVPIPDFVFKAICGNNGYVFKRQKVPRDINTVLSEMCMKAKIPAMTIHGLRHWYATSQLANGNDINAVSAALGHTNIAITQKFYVDSDTLMYEKRKAMCDIYA